MLSTRPTLESILARPDIWCGEALAVALPGIASGFPELDAQLPGNGWPRGALTEILLQREGIGEISLFVPALRELSRCRRWIAFVAPPYVPYAPALAREGIDLAYLLVIRAQSGPDKLWAVEQALRSGSCGAVLFWLSSGDERSLRRLQLAAEEGDALGVFFNRADALTRSSPAALRLHLAPDQGCLQARILKRRGGGAAAPLSLALSAPASILSRCRTLP